MNWRYVSGFFDGEGGITVTSKEGSNVLSLKVTMVQKSMTVLVRIKAFFLSEGIYSTIYATQTGICSLEIIRVDDITRFLKHLRVVVKRRQVLPLWTTSTEKSLGTNYFKSLIKNTAGSNAEAARCPSLAQDSP